MILTGFDAICALWNWENDWRSQRANLGASYHHESDRPTLKVVTLRNHAGQLTRHTRGNAKFSGGNFVCGTNGLTHLNFDYRAVAYHAYWSPTHQEPKESSNGTPQDLLLSVEFDDSIPFKITPPTGNRLSDLRAWQKLHRLNPLETSKQIVDIPERDDCPRIRIKVKQALSKGAPGVSQPVHLKAGQIVEIQIVDYPGEPLNPGSMGAIVAKYKGEEPVEKEWGFWSSGDIDLALLFKAEEVAEVIIPDTPKWRGIFQDSPFNITIDPEP